MSQTLTPLQAVLASLQLTETDTHRWECKPAGPMRVPARVFTDKQGIDDLLAEMKGQDWSALRQLINVTTLPGIQRAALAMADIHPGYGFPIGGVAAFDADEGVVSMAGVGFDINCGMRTLRTPLFERDLQGRQEQVLNQIWRDIPAGLGSEGDVVLNPEQLDTVLLGGAAEIVRRGYGLAADLEFIEEGGRVEGADPSVVSDTAKQRQRREVGTLGAGNHFVEVQVVDEVLDEDGAAAFGLAQGQVVVTLHTGSRALGHQIGNDYVPVLEAAGRKYGLEVPDREMAAAPISSPEARRYLSAVQCGANCAFANRQVLAHLVRHSIARLFNLPPEKIETLYEVCHNTAKFEIHDIDGQAKRVLVHRKGATRAFGPGRMEVPERYRELGQPVIVGGTMGTSSYILRGTQRGMVETFGSALHGAGRAMSRRRATKQYQPGDVQRQLREQGIHVRAHGRRALAEESPGAYKDVERVVRIMSEAGIVAPVVRLRPVICIKG
jgi:tRNA-splicing ligase RtcB